MWKTDWVFFTGQQPNVTFVDCSVYTQAQWSNLECSLIYNQNTLAHISHNELIRETENCRTNSWVIFVPHQTSHSSPHHCYCCCCSTAKLQAAASSHSGHKWLVIVCKMASEITIATHLQVYDTVGVFSSKCFISQSLGAFCGNGRSRAAHRFPVTLQGRPAIAQATYTHQASFINLAVSKHRRDAA